MTVSKPSKSAQKRETLELQRLGEELIELSGAELASIPLDAALRDAVRDAQRIKSRSAARRQKQLIGKLMRDANAATIRAELAKLRVADVRNKRTFAAAEKWRDRIVGEGSTALDQFETETGAAQPELHRMLADLEVAFSERAEKTLRRQIFRRIHEILVKIRR